MKIPVVYTFCFIFIHFLTFTARKCGKQEHDHQFNTYRYSCGVHDIQLLKMKRICDKMYLMYSISNNSYNKNK